MKPNFISTPLLFCCCSVLFPGILQSQIHVSVYTDKTVYAQDAGVIAEPILITLKAVNPTDSTVTIHWLNTAKDFYYIDDMDLIPDRGWLDYAPPTDVPPQDSLVWHYAYPGDNNPPIFSGRHLVMGEVALCGRDTFAIEVQSATEFGVRAQWNIVSIPLTVDDADVTALFPSALSDAYSYLSGYAGNESLQNGIGYWIKLPSAGSVTVTGTLRPEDTVEVREGWNMVGSLSDPVPVSNVGSIPGGIVTSNFYAYDGGYSSSPGLEPGSGYWVKASQAGQLVLSGASAIPSNRIRIQDTGELPPPPPDRLETGSPSACSLEQNYPNPFNPATSIRYTLPVTGHVKLSVFNMLGQEIALLVDEVRSAGDNVVYFDAGNLTSGVYMCRMTAGAFTGAMMMLLIR